MRRRGPRVRAGEAMPDFRIEANGRPATLDDVRRIAAFNYGHFTAMQWRDGGVRGLALHLERLDRGSRELFGTPLPAQRVRGCLAHALEGVEAPVSIRVNVFSRALDRDALATPVEPDVLVALGPAAQPAAAPWRVRCVPYEREAPHLKHVGTFGLFHQRRLAQQAGFDDAVFATRAARLSEGTIWNLVFHDGARWVWPDAPMLDGVTQQVVRRGLARLGEAQVTRPVQRDELPGFRAAFALNTAFVAHPIAAIDAVAFDPDPARLGTLLAAHDGEPAEPV